jgi:hypothetical protein
MMSARSYRRVMSLFVLLVTSMVLGMPAAMAHRFGTAPRNAVVAAAQAASKCAGLTSSELASMMLAASYEETVDGSSTVTPSPMTLGRHDTSILLYSYGTYATEQRAFAHGGLGLWQLDDAGLGANMTAQQRINVPISSAVAATTMASRYCNAGGSDAQRRAVAWGLWFACNGGACENEYLEHYCVATDTLCNITNDATVTNNGGMSTRTCRYNFDPSVNFVCYYVNPANAQGHKGSWQQAPLIGGTNGAQPSPLTHAFYNYLRSSDNKEFRHWIVADTGYTARGEVYVRRPNGTNGRMTNEWQDLDVLCDVTFGRGSC